MQDFSTALQEFHAGRADLESVRERLRDLLARPDADPQHALTALTRFAASHAMPDDARATLEAQIAVWMRDARGGTSAASADYPVTVLLAPTASMVTVDADHLRAPDGSAAGTLGPQRTSPTALRVGSVLLGRFELVEIIGVGGMSIVYRARDLRRVEGRQAETDVAVKVLTGPIEHYAEALTLLQSEAQKVQRVTHPSIVRVIDCDRDGDTVFMTMEYLRGRSLDRLFHERDFAGVPPAEADRILGAIVPALAALHDAGIVHGDLKPGNIVLADDGRIKLIDFGFARLGTMEQVIPSGEDRLPQALTPRYASPEMFDRRPADARDDVYALSCIAHELLTGRRPFGPLVANEARRQQRVPERDLKLSARQYDAIRRGLAFRRDDRTPTATEFLTQFRNPGRKPPGRGVAIAAGVAFVLVAVVVAVFRDVDPAPESREAALPAVPAAGQVFRDCATCPLMVVLPATAGATPVALAVSETTVGQYDRFRAAVAPAEPGSCEVYDGRWSRDLAANWKTPGFQQSPAHPVVCVSWQDATAFAQWLSAATGERYRLPTGAEWEHAARAGTADENPWPDGDLAAACRHGNVADEAAAERYPGWTVFGCRDGQVHTSPTGAFEGNGFGVHDLFGNAMEWVADCWRDGPTATGDACNEYETRGGSWFTSPEHVTATTPSRFPVDARNVSTGFRLLRELTP